MADIFHEIDEDLRRERFGRLWKRYGSWLIAAAVLIVVGVAGWRGYEYWQLKREQAAGAEFQAALKLADEGKNAEAEAAFAAIEKSGAGGYRTLARFRAAAVQAVTDPKAAVATYDGLANDSSLGGLMRDVARLRAAMLLVDTATLADITARLQPLNTPTGPFRNSAREFFGLAQYRAGDYDAAAKTFAEILSDGQTPPGMRQRVELMRTLSAAGAPAPASVEAVPSMPAMPSLSAPVATDAPAITEAPAAAAPATGEAPAVSPAPAAQ